MHLVENPVRVLLLDDDPENLLLRAAILRKHGYLTDTAGTIGKRYARADEVGTPYCVTVDGTTVDPGSPEKGTVTLRERDSKEQRRVRAEELLPTLRAAQLPARPPPSTPLVSAGAPAD